MSEVGLFLGALAFTILGFSSGSSVLQFGAQETHFAGIHRGAYALFRMSIGTFPATAYENFRQEPTLLAVLFIFLIASVVFLLKMLVAQLSCAYSAVYADMVGYARLQRAEIIVEIMPTIPKGRWDKFVDSLQLQKRLEFNEGDIGIKGGLAMKEAAQLNPTTIDMIKRFGGSTSPSIQWPEEADGENGDGEDRFERMEKLIQRALKRVTKSHGKSKGSKDGTGTGTGTGSAQKSGSGSSGGQSQASE